MTRAFAVAERYAWQVTLAAAEFLAAIDVMNGAHQHAQPEWEPQG